jgi:hypothetical protein
MIQYQNVYVVPSFHSKIQFACEVRKLFFEIRPDVIAVELPEGVRDKVLEGINHLPNISVVMYAEAKKKYVYIPIDPADSIIEAIRLGLEHNIPVEFIDLDVNNYRNKQYNFGVEGYSISKIGLDTFYHLILPQLSKSNYGTKDYQRELYMVKNLKRLMKNYKKVLFIVGMAHWERIKGFLKRNKLKDIENVIQRAEIKLFNLLPKSYIEVLREIPYITYLYEINRKNIKTPEEFFDKLEAYKTLYLNAKDNYFKNFGEPIHLAKMENILQYSRNYAFVENRLIPDLFHLVISAKNIVDDDYAGEVYDLAMSYFFQDKEQRYPSIEIRRKKGLFESRSVPLRRRVPIEKTVYKKIPLKRRPKEEYEGEWQEKWDKDYESVLSYPPEDLVFEDYMTYVRRKALKILMEDKVKIHEFNTSLMDGISMRDTLRNWHIDQKLYIREEIPPKGSIGPVVFVFETDDTLTHEYSYQLDWRHEHDQESDLYLYSTAPGINIIGPGISRGEYGGFSSIFPPGEYIDDTEYWNELEKVRNRADELLLKSIFLAGDHRYIVYAAKKPPDSYLKSLARKRGLYVIYIPLNEFNPSVIKKIRIVHFLNSTRVREYAKDYIFL